MPIKRYLANSDNTITNTFKTDYQTRATGSNSGLADILEIFSIYGEESLTSVELSRVLISFPITTLITDRAASTIPASGSVKFILKLYNAEHGSTLPRNYGLTVNGVSGSWQEGRGLDLQTYKDLTNDKIGSNWINAQDSSAAATATVTVADGDAANGMSENEKITIISSDGTTKNYIIVDDTLSTVATGDAVTSGVTDVGSTNATSTGVAVTIATTGSPVTQNTFLVQLKTAIEHENGHAGKITVSAVPTEADGNQAITLTQATKGRAGNQAIATDISQIVEGTLYSFTSGEGAWASQGGDVYTDSSSSFSQTFADGDEDISIDITTLVEQWMNSGGNVLGSKANHGLRIRLSDSYEGYDSSTNTDGSTDSYYTKTFFGRTTEYFFKRPAIEARWESGLKDDRANFYYSASIAPAADNLNTIYLYNYVRGKLVDIPTIESNSDICVSIFSGSEDNTEPYGPPLKMVADDGSSKSGVRSVVPYTVTGSKVSTGIYKATFAYTGSSTLKTIYDVWFSGSNVGVADASSAAVQYHTGSITPLNFYSSNINPNGNYVVSMPNLKRSYSPRETERFRLYVRNKDWSPTIYTKSKSTPQTLTIISASYQITRIVDQTIVISYGTGSNDNNYSLLSYDVSGNYFDLDMSMLEAGYTYGFQFSFYEDSVSSYREQPYLFKFKVENDEY
jgi:hypothetical protein